MRVRVRVGEGEGEGEGERIQPPSFFSHVEYRVLSAALPSVNVNKDAQHERPNISTAARDLCLDRPSRSCRIVCFAHLSLV